MSAWVFHHSQLQSALDAFLDKRVQRLDGEPEDLHQLAVEKAHMDRQLILDFLLSDEAVELRFKEPAHQPESQGVL